MSFDHLLYILGGVLITLKFSLISIFFGLIIALGVCSMRMSQKKLFSMIGSIYISAIRGTPLVLQLSIWYFAFPKAFAFKFSANLACAITFAVNSSAYLSEIIRAGVNSIDKGQMEAGKVLGLSKRDIMIDIILPQAMRNMSPALVNELISLTKETAIVAFIGITDLTRRAQLVSAETYNFFQPLLAAGLAYYSLTLFLTSAFAIIAKRYHIKI